MDRVVLVAVLQTEISLILGILPLWCEWWLTKVINLNTNSLISPALSWE